MNNTELKIVAKNLGINIDGADTAAQKRDVIKAASAGYSKRYDFVSNTWITGTEDVMPSTQAITAAEDQEDPRTDDAKKIQQVVRARQEKKKCQPSISFRR